MSAPKASKKATKKVTKKTTKKKVVTKKAAPKVDDELTPITSYDHFVENPTEIEGAVNGLSPEEATVFRKGLSNAEKNKAKKGSRRMLERTTMVYHDLYCLLSADTKKNIGILDPTLTDHENNQAYPPEWRVVPHKHFYHSVNSDGKKQIHCAPSAGHFHEMTVNEDSEGNISAECGPPIVMSRGKVAGYKNDKHIHETVYLQSEEIAKRVRSKDAAVMMRHIAAEETKAMSQGSKIAREK